MEINLESSNAVQKLCKFSKDSILYYYIFAIIAIHFRQEYRENNDLYEEGDIAEIEAIFQDYEIKLLPFKTFYKNSRKDLEYINEAFYEWFCDQENQFEELWETITEEVFQLLFANLFFIKLQSNYFVLPKK